MLAKMTFYDAASLAPKAELLLTLTELTFDVVNPSGDTITVPYEYIQNVNAGDVVIINNLYVYMVSAIDKQIQRLELMQFLYYSSVKFSEYLFDGDITLTGQHIMDKIIESHSEVINPILSVINYMLPPTFDFIQYINLQENNFFVKNGKSSTYFIEYDIAELITTLMSDINFNYSFTYDIEYNNGEISVINLNMTEKSTVFDINIDSDPRIISYEFPDVSDATLAIIGQNLVKYYSLTNPDNPADTNWDYGLVTTMQKGIVYKLEDGTVVFSDLSDNGFAPETIVGSNITIDRIIYETDLSVDLTPLSKEYALANSKNLEDELRLEFLESPKTEISITYNIHPNLIANFTVGDNVRLISGGNTFLTFVSAIILKDETITVTLGNNRDDFLLQVSEDNK